MTIKETMMPVISSYHGATTFGQTSPGNTANWFVQSSLLRDKYVLMTGIILICYSLG